MKYIYLVVTHVKKYEYQEEPIKTYYPYEEFYGESLVLTNDYSTISGFVEKKEACHYLNQLFKERVEQVKRDYDELAKHKVEILDRTLSQNPSFEIIFDKPLHEEIIHVIHCQVQEIMLQESTDDLTTIQQVFPF